jgi:uncharacterized Zn finger protein
MPKDKKLECRMQSETDPKRWYDVSVELDGNYGANRCSCEEFIYRQWCKHIEKVLDISLYEV